MANKKPAPAAEAAAPAAGGGSKKRLIIIIVLGILLVALSIGGTIAALKFLGPKDKPAGEKDEHAAAADEHGSEEASGKDKDGKPLPSIYLELKPEITVSFEVGGRQRFLKATVNALTRDHVVESALTVHSPAVANAMVMLISSKKFEDLQTPEGKEALRVEALEQINTIMEKETHKKHAVEQILFSEFIMQ